MDGANAHWWHGSSTARVFELGIFCICTSARNRSSSGRKAILGVNSLFVCILRPFSSRNYGVIEETDLSGLFHETHHDSPSSLILTPTAAVATGHPQPILLAHSELDELKLGELKPSRRRIFGFLVISSLTGQVAFRARDLQQL